MKRHRLKFVWLGFAFAAVAACGSEAAQDGDGTGGDPYGDGTGNTFVTNGSDGGSLLGNGSLGACATETKKAEIVPLDIVIGLDTSFSMDFDNKWPSVKSALNSFVANPSYAGLGVGLQFYPLRKQCSVSDYSNPAVPIAMLPGGASAVAAALQSQNMSGGTPIVPLLEGLTQYLKTWAAAHPERKAVLILATDGVPDYTCVGTSTGRSNTLDNAVAVASGAANGTPKVSTFVIGVGSELTALDAIGTAGGTGKAILVDTNSNVEQEFGKALQTIRKQAIPCDYTIPKFNGVTPDPSKINVTFTPAPGAPQQLFLYADTPGKCDAAKPGGWYLDNPAQPTKVILCPNTCAAVKGTEDGRVDVVYGCARVEVR